MADPVTLAGIGIGSAAAGGITGAIGQLFSGSANAAMYKYQAGVANVNANLATQDANYAEAAGDEELIQAGLKGREEVGQTKATQGAGNIDVSSGSAATVRRSEIEVTQENEAIINANTQKRVFGYQVESAKDVAQAGADTTAAGTSITAGTLGAVSTVLGSAGSVSAKWLQGTQSGIFSSGSPDTWRITD